MALDGLPGIRGNNVGRPGRGRAVADGWVVRGAVAGLLLISLPGCLNPNLLNQSTGSFFPLAPGDEPFLAVRVINDTSADITLPIVYDDGTGAKTFLIGVQASEVAGLDLGDIQSQEEGLTPEGRETGVVLRWPVLRVAIGDLDNPALPSIAASIPGPTREAILAPSGLRALELGVDYGMGDAIIYHINQDSRSPVFITASAGVIKGAAHANPSRADPFAVARLLISAFESGGLGAELEGLFAPAAGGG